MRDTRTDGRQTHRTIDALYSIHVDVARQKVSVDAVSEVQKYSKIRPARTPLGKLRLLSGVGAFLLLPSL